MDFVAVSNTFFSSFPIGSNATFMTFVDVLAEFCLPHADSERVINRAPKAATFAAKRSTLVDLPLNNFATTLKLLHQLFSPDRYRLDFHQPILRKPRNFDRRARRWVISNKFGIHFVHDWKVVHVLQKNRRLNNIPKTHSCRL